MTVVRVMMISTKHFSLLLLIVICSWVTLGEPTEGEKQVMLAKSYISDSFDYSHEFQNYGKKTHDLQEYREFDRSLTPKMGNNNDHLQQVRSFILKNGFQEPIIIISCDLKTGNAISLIMKATIVSGWPTRKVYHPYHAV